MNNLSEITTLPIAAQAAVPFQLQAQPDCDYYDLKLQPINALCLFNSESREFPRNAYLTGTCPIESKEQTHANADIIRVILSDSRETISIAVPPEIENQDNPVIPKETRAVSTHLPVEIPPEPTPVAEQESRVCLCEAEEPAPIVRQKTAKGEKIITFEIRDIFKSSTNDNRIRVYVKDPSRQSRGETVSLGRLMNLISKYPEPIILEIANFEQAIFPCADIDHLLIQKPIINFTFDIRDMIKTDMSEAAGIKIVEGVLTSRFPQRPINTAPETQLKPKPRIRHKANSQRQANPGGKFEMAVAPDQYSPKNMSVKQAPFDLTRSGNPLQAKIAEIKDILLKAIDKNVKTLRFKLEPKELGSLDIRLNLGDDGVSILMGADHPDINNMLSPHLPDMKIGLDGAGVKILEVQIIQDKVTQMDKDSLSHSPRSEFDGKGRGDKKTWRHLIR